MKSIPKWVKAIIFILIYIGIAALSKYDAENKSWFLATITWLVGTTFLIKWACKQLKKLLEKEESKDGSVDYLSLALGFGISFAIIAVVFTAGLDPSFGFYGVFSFDAKTPPSFLTCVTNGIVMIIGLLLISPIFLLLCSIAVYLLSKIWFHFYCGTSEIAPELTGVITTGITGIGFLILSYICGILDIDCIYTFISSIVGRF